VEHLVAWRERCVVLSNSCTSWKEPEVDRSPQVVEKTKFERKR
jgi:hypothetical protein